MAHLVGRVFERTADGGIGRPVPRATLAFAPLRGRDRAEAQTDGSGRFRADIDPGRYRVRIRHPEYEAGSGLVVVRFLGGVANFFLERSDDGREPEASTFRGRVFERRADRSIGPTVPGATLTFRREGTDDTWTVGAGSHGAYAVELPLGRYVVAAEAEGYEPYSSEPGVFVLGPRPSTANVFLEPAAPAVSPSRFVFRGDRRFHHKTVLG